MTILNRIGAVGDPNRAHGIARNIEALLNSKRGYGGTLAHFGLADLEIEDEIAVHLEQLADDMQDQLERFEPRLSPVSVRVLPSTDIQRVVLAIEGVDRGRVRRFQARYDAYLRCVDVSVIVEVKP